MSYGNGTCMFFFAALTVFYQPDAYFEDKEVPETRPENTETTFGLSSPIIVYADLIATGGPRNLETAQRLRDEYTTEPDGTA